MTDESSGRRAAEPAVEDDRDDRDDRGMRIQAIVADVAGHIAADERELLRELERHRPDSTATRTLRQQVNTLKELVTRLDGAGALAEGAGRRLDDLQRAWDDHRRLEAAVLAGEPEVADLLDGDLPPDGGTAGERRILTEQHPWPHGQDPG